MKRAPWIAGIIVAAVALLGLWSALRRTPRAVVAEARRPAVVTVAPVSRGAITETITVSGTLQAGGRIELTAQIPSKVVAVPVAEGARVAAGAVVVRLDATEIEAGILRAEAGRQARAAQLSKARTGLVAARQAAAARVRRAAGGREAAEANARQAELGVGLTAAQSESDLATAEAGVAAAEASYQQAQRALALERQQAERDVAEAEAGLRAATADLERATAGAAVAGATATAEVDRARAGVSAAEAALARVRAGARPEEIAAAEANVRQARAARDHAAKEVEDLEYLYRNGGVAGADLRGARTQLDVAEAQLAAAEAQLQGARAGAGASELAAAEAQLESARAGLRAAEAAARRSEVSAAEVAAATAQRDRAKAGLEAARAVRDERVALAEQRAAAARAALDQARAGLRAAQAATGRVGVQEAQASAARAQVRGARAGEDEAAAGRVEAAAVAADVAAAEAALVEAEAQYRLALSQRDRTTVTTPLAGIVTQLSVDVGDTVLPGMPLAVIETVGATVLEALCSPEQRARIQVGQRATVTVGGRPDALSGTVTDVAQTAEADGRTFKVRIAVAGRDLPAGVYATAAIAVAEARDALLLPLAAIGDLDGERPYVYVAEGGKAVRHDVTLGLRSDELAQALHGVEAGWQVVVEGAAAIFDGAPIEIAPATPGG